MSTRRLHALLTLLFLGLGLAPSAFSDVVVDPNQLVGEVGFTNANPEILARLWRRTGTPPGAGEGLWYAETHATSLPPQTPTLEHESSDISQQPVVAPYELTVESGPPGSGIRYRLWSDLVLEYDTRIGSGRDRYFTAEYDSGPAEREPAPDVVTDLRECAGMMHVAWVDELGEPVPIVDGSVWAYREIAPGSGTYENLPQASSYLAELDAPEFWFPARGDDTAYAVIGIYRLRTPQGDVLTARAEVVTLRCDEIVHRTYRYRLGDAIETALVGNADVLGEEELPATVVKAFDGPFDFLFSSPIDEPWHGPWRIDVFPSEIVSPPRGYLLYTDFFIRRPPRHEWLRTLWYGGPDGHVFVSAGSVVDVGDAFVVDPGEVRGDVYLAGPAPGPAGSPFESLFIAGDADGDGVPENFGGSTRVGAWGVAPPLFGYTGMAYAQFPGAIEPATGDFRGDYELVLGGLFRGAGGWRPHQLDVSFIHDEDANGPASYVYNQFEIRDQTIPISTIAPGSLTEIPRHYCVSRVEVRYRTTSGRFYGPRLTSTGTFSGLDFEGREASYSALTSWAHGTPRFESDAADTGLVVLYLPQGRHTLSPVVYALDPSGGTSRVELDPVTIDVGCRQVIAIDGDLSLELDAAPVCASTRVLPVTGRVDSTASVTRIAWRLDGGTETDVCAPCGEDPGYAFDVPLAGCENTLEVLAWDEGGGTASTSAVVRFDPAVPVIDGCADIAAELDPAAGGAVVTFAPTVSDGCDPSPALSCAPASGTLFPEGQTRVTCRASDRCANRSLCRFMVTVAPDVDPPLRADAGPDRWVCPAATAGVGGAPSASGGRPPYTYAWTPVAAFDDPALPNPQALATGMATLTVTDSRARIASDSAAVAPVPPPQALGEHAAQTCFGCDPVTFTDRSSGGVVAWRWDFGDGRGSAERSPAHVYSAPGRYDVTLTVTDACGQTSVWTSTIDVVGRPHAAFQVPQPACPGTAAAFTSTSSPDATGFVWDFGDGSPVSTLRDPLHAYAAAGVYVVRLVAANACGAGDPAYATVSVGGSVAASFTSDAPRCSGPVQFRDTSAGLPVTWLWDFGDGTPPGTTSAPLHTYASPGAYTVTLTAGDACGGTSIATGRAEVDPALGAAFSRWDACEAPRAPGTAPSPPYSPEDTSLATTLSTSWEFDDGSFCRASSCSFAMYAVADCGTAMKIPLYDNETGKLRIFDLRRQAYVPIDARGSSASCPFQQDQVLEASWQDCTGNDCRWNDATTTLSFSGSPAVCGVYRLEFDDWGGFWWDLFANCDGSNSPGFRIYDNVCDALDAYRPLPELVVRNASVAGVCPAYSVSFEVENSGCATVDATVRVSSSQGGSLDTLVTGLEPGRPRSVTVDLAVQSCVPGQVTVSMDPDQTVEECSESQGSSVSCGASAPGADAVTIALPPPCLDPPVFCGALEARDLDPCADTGVRVAWPQVSSPGSGGSVTYELYRDDVLLVAGLLVTEHVDLGGTNGVTHRYRVRAVNACGLGDLSFTEVTAADLVSPRDPASVGNALLAVKWLGDVRLTWPPPAGALTSRVLRDVERRFAAASELARVPAPTGVAVDRDAVAPGTGPLLFYRVRGLNCAGVEGP